MRGHGWKHYEQAAEKGPVSFGIKAIIGIAIVLAVMAAIGTVFGWFGESARVARETFGPQATVVKYEWFKDAHAQLEKQRADIAVFEQQLAEMATEYGADRTRWPRDVREEYNQRRAELTGVIANHNRLVADYNANASKATWAYAEGDIPRTQVEYRSSQ